jgi:oxalate decarboxylase
MSAAANVPEPIVYVVAGRSSGRTMSPVELENPRRPHLAVDRCRDHPNLKFPYAMARSCVLSAGFAREITARELPVATGAGRRRHAHDPGGNRELHWHKDAEWACRELPRQHLDEEGRFFIDDVGSGTSRPGCRIRSRHSTKGPSFLLVFDDGSGARRCLKGEKSTTKRRD